MARGSFDDDLRMPKIPLKTIGIGIIGIIILIFAFIVIGGMYSQVPGGYYQVAQEWSFLGGNMKAKMTPGLWFPFGATYDWPKEKTFFFTSDKDHREDTDRDLSIEVRFNDGSLCKISGTCRVIFPSSEKEAVDLVVRNGYVSPDDVMTKLVLPTLRNSLRMSANLMSARQSYSEKRPDFITWTWEQIQHGVYITTEEWKKVEDPVTGEKVSKYVKVIKKDKDGNPLHTFNPLHDTGVRLSNLEVKQFVYSKTVAEQIKKQQTAIMDVETARAEAQKAEQNKLTEKAKGEAEAIKAKWLKEKEKAQAVVDAEKMKRVAEIAAEQKLKVAELGKQAAAQDKQAKILLAEGEAKARELKMKADDYKAMKIQAWRETQLAWAEAFKTRPVPRTILGGANTNTDGQFFSGQKMLELMSLKALGLDIGVGPTQTTAQVSTQRR